MIEKMKMSGYNFFWVSKFPVHRTSNAVVLFVSSHWGILNSTGPVGKTTTCCIASKCLCIRCAWFQVPSIRTATGTISATWAELSPVAPVGPVAGKSAVSGTASSDGYTTKQWLRLSWISSFRSWSSSATPWTKIVSFVGHHELQQLSSVWCSSPLLSNDRCSNAEDPYITQTTLTWRDTTSVFAPALWCIHTTNLMFHRFSSSSDLLRIVWIDSQIQYWFCIMHFSHLPSLEDWTSKISGSR